MDNETTDRTRRRPRPSLAGAALPVVAALATACWLALHRWYGLPEHADHTHFAFEKVPGGFRSSILQNTLWLFAAVSALYAVGFAVLARAGRLSRWAKLGALGAMVGPGLVNLWLYPVGALDVFNYMIELKLAFHFDENPYLTTFAAYRADPFALPAFLVDVKLFYGPAWLLATGIPALVAGFDDVLRLLLAIKAFNLLLLGAIAALIFRAQRDQRRGWLAAYALVANPLVLFEGVANAHNDVLMTLFLVAAVIAARDGRWLTGPALAAGALVKFFVLPLAPLLAVAHLRTRGGRRALLPATLGGAIVVVGLVAPFWAGGAMWDGLKEGTTESQAMNHVSPFSLTQQLWRQERAQAVPEGSAFRQMEQRWEWERPFPEDDLALLRQRFGIAFAAVVALLALAVWRGFALERALVVAYLAFALLLTNLYAWYLIPAFALLALRLDRLGAAFMWIQTGLGLAYYPVYVWARYQSGYDELEIHLFLARFLTVPIVVYLAIETTRPTLGRIARFALGRWRRRWPDTSDAPPLTRGLDERGRGGEGWASGGEPPHRGGGARTVELPR
ncbi:MAG: hypothetical protein AVDCRST_MAG73-1314 [uncultured Thermomicrobiales bacterium]|uniref:DUF2029 domain-containing protein n=1 Tax=uncultured Thermomicrobiales bacterium TaxID=1645740 RepID=A0A6J4TXJ4_9BACT|nr:MAG: hypothetical protein AVDCRST_MAG73-1314 [uncultured Thermomicrobiales bacterium]